jgi:hypothetical protein
MSQLPRKARHQTGESIKDLVCAIRNSGRRIDYAYGRMDTIREANDIRSPRVDVGYHLNGNGEKETIYAYSHDEIDSFRKPHAEAFLSWSPSWHQRVGFALAGNILHAKLQREIEETELRERQTGAAEWRERWQKALAEYEAGIALFLRSTPGNAFEANLKISFLAHLVDTGWVKDDAIPKAIRDLHISGRDGGASSSRRDPIMHKIKAHRAAREAWGKSFRTQGDNGDPALAKADRAAWKSLVATKPVTVAGAAALLDYLISVEGECIKGTGDTLRVIRTVSNALPFVSMSRAMQ